MIDDLLRCASVLGAGVLAFVGRCVRMDSPCTNCSSGVKKLSVSKIEQDPVRSITIVLASVSFALSLSASAHAKPPLPKHMVLGPVRVFYTVEGSSAVPRADTNRNSISDHVEDVAKQVWAAHQLFCGALEFPDPFQSERYPGLTCIEVRIWDRNEIGGGNGVAFEGSQRARTIPEGKPKDRAIVMSVGKHVDARKNVTPAHEFFHMIQYGTTYFKNRWYLEGMARWSEHGLGRDGLGQTKYPPNGRWPQSPQQLRLLANMTYDAEFVLWNPIASRFDRKGELPRSRLTIELRSLRYSDGTPVLRDHLLNGASLMRDVLLELGKFDDIAFKDLKYTEWSEENQKSAKNDPYIYQAVMDVLRRRSPPVGRFNARPKSR